MDFGMSNDNTEEFGGNFNDPEIEEAAEEICENLIPFLAELITEALKTEEKEAKSVEKPFANKTSKKFDPQNYSLQSKVSRNQRREDLCNSAIDNVMDHLQNVKISEKPSMGLGGGGCSGGKGSGSEIGDKLRKLIYNTISEKKQKNEIFAIRENLRRMSAEARKEAVYNALAKKNCFR